MSELFPAQPKTERQISHEKLYISSGYDLTKVIEEAFKRTTNDPTPEDFRGRGFLSNHMHWNVLGLLRQQYKDHLKFDKHKRPYIKLQNKARLYFKKLDSKYRPENIETDHVKELNTMSMAFSVEQISILYVGYRVQHNRKTGAWNALSGCYLVEMRDEETPNWVSNMHELSIGINAAKEQYISPINLDTEITVKPKRNDSDATGTNKQ